MLGSTLLTLIMAEEDYFFDDNCIDLTRLKKCKKNIIDKLGERVYNILMLMMRDYESRIYLHDLKEIITKTDTPIEKLINVDKINYKQNILWMEKNTHIYWEKNTRSSEIKIKEIKSNKYYGNEQAIELKENMAAYYRDELDIKYNTASYIAHCIVEYPDDLDISEWSGLENVSLDIVDVNKALERIIFSELALYFHPYRCAKCRKSNGTVSRLANVYQKMK